MASFVAVETNFARTVRFYNGSATTYVAGDLLTISAGTVAKVADSNTIVGVLGVVKTASVAQYAYGEVWIEGIFKATVAGTIDFVQGGKVYAASASTVDDGTASDVPIGFIVTEEPASGATSVYFSLASFLCTTVAVHA